MVAVQVHLHAKIGILSNANSSPSISVHEWCHPFMTPFGRERGESHNGRCQYTSHVIVRPVRPIIRYITQHHWGKPKIVVLLMHTVCLQLCCPDNRGTCFKIITYMYQFYESLFLLYQTVWTSMNQQIRHRWKGGGDLSFWKGNKRGIQVQLRTERGGGQVFIQGGKVIKNERNFSALYFFIF